MASRLHILMESCPLMMHTGIYKCTKAFLFSNELLSAFLFVYCCRAAEDGIPAKSKGPRVIMITGVRLAVLRGYAFANTHNACDKAHKMHAHGMHD